MWLGSFVSARDGGTRKAMHDGSGCPRSLGKGLARAQENKEYNMVSEKVTLINPQGLHMRPAGTFASAMGKFASTVTVVANGKETNGKSPMALMAAGLSCGTEIEIKCDGADEADALAAAVELVKSGIGE